MKVVLKTSGKRYAQEAKTIDEGLAALGLKWNNIKGKGTITVYSGRYSYEHLFYMPALKRIFGSKLTRALWAKRLGVLLKASKHNSKYL